MVGRVSSLGLAALLLLAPGRTFADPVSEDPASRAAVERYFAATNDEDRRSAARELSTLDVGAVARLVNTRPEWAGTTAGVYYVNETYGGKPARYFLGVPQAYSPDDPVPLVVMLPSPMPFVALPLPDADKVERIYAQWVTDELTKHPDAAVVIPLVNLDELYGPGPAGVDSVIGALRHAAGKVRVDPTRVYLLGHGAGAHATWNLAFAFPTYFAAVAPFAGAASGDWQRLRQVNLRNVGVIVWQDVDEPVIKLNPTRELVASLKRLKVDVDYLQTRGMGHAPTAVVVENRYAAMRKRVKDLYPRSVSIQTNRPEPEFCRVEWLEITEVLNPMSPRRLLPRHGSGQINVYQNPAKAEATINPEKNAIDILSTNAARLRVHLATDLLDLTRPVTITVNRKVRYSGLPVPSVVALLDDARALGRGWRSYPVSIDLDLTKPASPAPPATRPANQ